MKIQIEKSICKCGHVGELICSCDDVSACCCFPNGVDTDHDVQTIVISGITYKAIGHGKCRKCNCQQFTWERFE